MSDFKFSPTKKIYHLRFTLFSDQNTLLEIFRDENSKSFFLKKDRNITPFKYLLEHPGIYTLTEYKRIAGVFPKNKSDRLIINHLRVSKNRFVKLLKTLDEELSEGLELGIQIAKKGNKTFIELPVLPFLELKVIQPDAKDNLKM